MLWRREGGAEPATSPPHRLAKAEPVLVEACLGEGCAAPALLSS